MSESDTQGLMYLRSGPRPVDEQRAELECAAASAGLHISGEFFDDQHVSELSDRTGFEELLDCLSIDKSINAVLVLDAQHISSDFLTVQVAANAIMGRGARLMNGKGETLGNLVSSKITPLVAEAFARFEKTLCKRKSQLALDRKRSAERQRKKYLRNLTLDERRKVAACRLARRLRKTASTVHKRLGYRAIARKLEEAGFVTKNGRRYSMSAIKELLEVELPR